MCVKSPDEDFADEAEPKFISLNVFHSPQFGHLPIHFVDSCPQLLQTYAVLVFAIIMIVLYICRGIYRHALLPTKVTIFFVVSKFIATFAT